MPGSAAANPVANDPSADEIKTTKKSFPFGPIYPHWPVVNSQSFNHGYRMETRK